MAFPPTTMTTVETAAETAVGAGMMADSEDYCMMDLVPRHAVAASVAATAITAATAAFPMMMITGAMKVSLSLVFVAPLWNKKKKKPSSSLVTVVMMIMLTKTRTQR